MYDNPWWHEDKVFDTDSINGYYGFVYLITNTTNGRKYIGRKYFWSFRKKKGQNRRSKQESDWKKYWGSNKPLLELLKSEPKENFTKEILRFASTKKLLTYYETQVLFVYRVLEEPEMYYNDNVLGKFFRKDFD